MTVRIRVGLTAFLALALATNAFVARFSDPASQDDPRAVRWLTSHPQGGALTGPAEITYTVPDGSTALTITFDQAVGASSDDCPDGYLCLYAGLHGGYPRASTQTCGLISLNERGWEEVTQSVRNNLPGGEDQGQWAAGTVSFYHFDGGVPNDDTVHKVLNLRPTAGAAVTVPAGITFAYHYC